MDSQQQQQMLSTPSGGSPLTPDERTWGMLAHLSTILLPFIGPLLVLLIKGEQSSWVRANAIEALNFEITVFIAALVSSVLVCIGIGVLLAPVVGMAALVLGILASIRANAGEMYRYPLTLRLIK